MMNPNYDFGMMEIELERVKLQFMTAISEELMQYFANEPDVFFNTNGFGREMILRVTQDVLQHKLETVEVKYPSDWWQSFKERWFPDWLLEKYPVEYEEKKLEAKIILPDIAIPRDRYNWYLHITEEEVWQ